MKTITGKTFSEMVLNGYRDLKNHYEKVNDLNVFPVPDGDTGTNIAATLTGGVNAMKDANFDSIGDVAEKLAGGMLLGARGNSGVIISQFFQGISEALASLDTANVTQFASALRSGTSKAYEAVVHPVEGTVLTVARESTVYIMDNLSHINDFETLFEDLLREMRLSLDRTPDLLPVLKEAGVIDSGGAGLVYIMEGMGKYIVGEEIADAEFNGPTNGVATDEKIPFDENSVLDYGYCTEFILQLLVSKCDPKAFDLKEMIHFLEGIGDSIVALKQKSIVKVHVHTKEPWKAIQYAQKFGEFVTFKMENMSIQHNEKLLKEMPIEEEKPTEHIVANEKRQEVQIVAVSPSSSITELFLNMGANQIVSGGQTMNPSADDFIKAFDAANADNIIVFPNNSNIILTAEQAAKLYTKSKVYVLHSKSVVEAYSALSMAYFDGQDIDECIEGMNESMKGVVSAEISPAIRDSLNNGISIKKGDYMGILMHNIVSSSPNMMETIKELLNKVPEIEDKSVFTIFYGEDADAQVKKDLAGLVKKDFPNLEMVEIDGRQSIYPLIFALE
ncbi:MAG: DAK2 domain-containing protein [Bacilli bacterium]|nr:DAK2 domain-containing protein [Bacilli bacterium]